MMLKKIIKLSASALMFSVLLFAGCKSTSGAARSDAAKSLAPWKGEWQSIDSVSSASALNDTYMTVAAKMPHYTEAGLRAAIASAYASPITKAKFDGSNTVIFTVKNADGKETEIACEYRYKGDVPMAGSNKHSWQTFEAVKDVRGLMQAKYFIAVAPHQHGKDGLLHWHARFGARSISELVNGDANWWPTYAPASMPKDELTKQFAKSIEGMSAMLPVEPFEIYSEKGKWINSSLIYEDERPAIKKAYDALIKEFAGKNNGKDFTKAEIVALAKKAYGTTEDFTHLEFVTAGDKNELVVWKDANEVLRLAYKQDAANPSKPTLKAFTAVDTKKAGKFAHISITNPHGTPAHMHLWYGANDAAIGAMKIKPTCIPANSAEADVATRVMNTCKRFLQEASK